MNSWLLSPEEWTVLLLSMRVALLSMLLMLLPGILIGWALARFEFPFKNLLNAVVHAPLVLPPVATGYLLLLLFGKQGVLGQWLYQAFGIQLAFSWRGAVFASAVMAFPLLVRSVRLGFELIDRRLEQAALTLGASPLSLFVSVTLPLALPGVLAGAILAFARSLGEFGATITFAGNIFGETRTLPLAIYTYLQVPSGDAPAFRLVLISMLLSVGALVASEALGKWLTKRLGGNADA